MLKLFQKEDNYISTYKYDTANGKRYYVKCGNLTKRGFKTKKEAITYEKELKRKALYLVKDLDDLSEIKEDSVYFYDVINDYVELLDAETDVKYGTNRKKKEMIKYAIQPNFQNKPLNTITAKDCVIFRSKIKNTGYSTSQKNQILQTFKAIFKHAKKYMNYEKDPTYVVEPFKKTFEDKMKKKKKDEHIWTNEDFVKFIAKVDKKQYKVFFTVLFYTGIRLGEAQALQWNDLDGEVLHIYKAMSKECAGQANRLIKSSPKTVNSIRDIHIGEELELYLLDYKKSLQEANPNFSDEWYMFGGENYISRTSATRYKDKAIKASGVPRITLHEFRHAHASNLIASGANIVSVSRRLGHSSVSITLDTYTHLLDRDESEIISKIQFKK